MQQNTINNYLNSSSLFRAHRPTPAQLAKSEITNKSYTPTRSQYTPANPTNFKVKQSLLCKSCQDKKHSTYIRESKKLNELEGIQRDLQSRKEVTNQPIVQKTIHEEPLIMEGTRPPNYVFQQDKKPTYLSKTVEMNQHQNQNRAYVLQRTVPSVPYTTQLTPKRTVEPIVMPIRQETIQQSTSKEEDILKSKQQANNHMRNTQQSNVHIMINNNNEKLNASKEIGTPKEVRVVTENQTETGNLSANNYFITRTESNYLSEADHKQEEETNIKKWNQPLSQRKEEPKNKEEQIKIETSSRGGSNFQRIIGYSNKNKNSSIGVNTSQQSILQLRQNITYSADQDRNNFFNSTKRDTNKYIQNIKNRLIQSYKSLEIIETEIDNLVEKNLDDECQKLQVNLYKVIDQELKEFKQNQRKKLSKTKFSYMSDLYEIKCNIDLRLQELEDYQLAFGSQHKWKAIVADLLTPDYESTIQFLVSKSAEIQEDSIAHTENFISEYNNKMFVEVQEPLKKEMKVSIENLFVNFTRMREKKIGYQAFIEKYFEEEKTKR